MLRRTFTLGLVATALSSRSAHASDVDAALTNGLRAIEAATTGTLLVGIVDEDGRQFAHGTQPFPLHALQRPLLAALALQQMEQDKLNADEVIRLDVAARMADAPHTAAHITDGMTLLALAQATVPANDRLATRLLLDKVGGTTALNTWLQQRDARTTVDASGAPQSTVAGAASTVASVFLKGGPHVSSTTRALLNQWLQQAAPNSWRVARSMRAWRPASIAPDDTGQVDLVVVTPGKARAVVVVAWDGQQPTSVFRQTGEVVARWLN